MPFGVQVEDAEMASIAKMLQISHFSFVCLAVVGLIVGVVFMVMFNNMLSEYAEASGTIYVTGAGQGPEQLASPIIAIGAAMACTVWVWSSIKKNDKAAFGMICIGEGCCCVLAGCSALSYVISLTAFGVLGPLFENAKENCAYSHSGGSGYGGNTGGSMTSQQCVDAMDAVIAMMGTAQIIVIFLLAVAALEMLCCGLGCYSANNAKTKLEAGKSFTGTVQQAPPTVLGTTVSTPQPKV